MFKKHDMNPNVHSQTHTLDACRGEKGKWRRPAVVHQHHGQRLTHRGPIRGAVTRQAVRQALTAGLDEDREPLV